MSSKSNLTILILLALISFSCSQEEELQTYTLTFEALGNGEVERIIHTTNCGKDFTSCASEVILENPPFPFKAVVEDYYSELIYMRVIVGDQEQKENITELKITVDKKVHILKKEDFRWNDDSIYGIELQFGVSI